MSREFAGTRGITKVLRATVQNVKQTFDSQVVILLQNAAGHLQPWGDVTGWWAEGVSDQTVFAPGTHDQGVAQWVFDHGRRAGMGTDTLTTSDTSAFVRARP